MGQALPMEVRAGAKVAKGRRSKGPEFDAWQRAKGCGEGRIGRPYDEADSAEA